MLMVKAKRNGVYDNAYRYTGDRFPIECEQKFSRHWMERLTVDEVKEAEDVVKANKQAEADILASRKKEAKDRAEARVADRASIAERNKEVAEIKARKAQGKSDKK